MLCYKRFYKTLVWCTHTESFVQSYTELHTNTELHSIQSFRKYARIDYNNSLYFRTIFISVLRHSRTIFFSPFNFNHKETVSIVFLVFIDIKVIDNEQHKSSKKKLMMCQEWKINTKLLCSSMMTNPSLFLWLIIYGHIKYYQYYVFPFSRTIIALLGSEALVFFTEHA